MDVGSPVVCLHCSGSSERYELTAMFASGNACVRDKRPRLVTNVATHLEWIRKKYKYKKT